MQFLKIQTCLTCQFVIRFWMRPHLLSMQNQKGSCKKHLNLYVKAGRYWLSVRNYEKYVDMYIILPCLLLSISSSTQYHKKRGCHCSRFRRENCGMGNASSTERKRRNLQPTNQTARKSAMILFR